MNVKRYRVTLDIAVDLDVNPPPSEWDWAEGLDHTHPVEVVSCKELPDRVFKTDLNEWRVRQNWAIQELADKIGVGFYRCQNWCSGIRFPPPEMREKIRALGFTGHFGPRD